ncbi:hypothetical protein QBZ16_004507 [Prototheca wickerhamii]|uniref:Uncharacterized protein n=1 Tax=Prototheca wickerhamii TaxID=3111 RepID=A0AAD9IFW2_PROWI|nr:hypothetical protein QBZ16_004507 [Prototheca wickerhamii]
MSLVTSIDALAEEAHRRIDHGGEQCPGASDEAVSGQPGGLHEKLWARSGPAPSLQRSQDAGAVSSGGACDTVGPADVAPSSDGRKRRRGQGPTESCPFCGHYYTVRDGLSNKLDAAGNRLHQRKCQCRLKTPPCRNCPSCKQDPQLMAQSDPAAQRRACRRLGCAILDRGRRALAPRLRERTARRAGQLEAIGRQLLLGDPAALDRDAAAEGASGWSVKRLPADIRSTLSALKEQQQQRGAALASGSPRDASGGQGDAWDGARAAPGADHPTAPAPEPAHAHHCQHPHADCTSACCSAPGAGAERARAQAVVDTAAWRGGPDAYAALPGEGAAPDAQLFMEQFLKRLFTNQGSPATALRRRAGPGRGGAAAATPRAGRPTLGAGTPPQAHPPAQAAQALSKSARPLPPEVAALVTKIFEPSLGPQGVEVVAGFLSDQCVAGLEDLEFLELDWMIGALQPRGVPPLLLNKFLTVGRRTADSCRAA